MVHEWEKVYEYSLKRIVEGGGTGGSGGLKKYNKKKEGEDEKNENDEQLLVFSNARDSCFISLTNHRKDSFCMCLLYL